VIVHGQNEVRVELVGDADARRGEVGEEAVVAAAAKAEAAAEAVKGEAGDEDEVDGGEGDEGGSGGGLGHAKGVADEAAGLVAADGELAAGQRAGEGPDLAGVVVDQLLEGDLVAKGEVGHDGGGALKGGPGGEMAADGVAGAVDLLRGEGSPSGEELAAEGGFVHGPGLYHKERRPGGSYR